MLQLQSAPEVAVKASLQVVVEDESPAKQVTIVEAARPAYLRVVSQEV